MDYITAEAAAAKWGVTPRQVQRLLADGRIPGVQKYGRAWMIPANTAKPGDPRREKKKTPCEAFAADLGRIVAAAYTPGPRDGPGAARNPALDKRIAPIAECAIAFWRGDLEQSARCFCEIEGDDAVKLCACPSAISAAICAGDYPLYIEIKTFLEGVAKTNRFESGVVTFTELALAAAYTGAMAPAMVAEWLKSGDVSALPDAVRPDALHARAKYFQGLRQYDAMLAVAQTALTFCASPGGFSHVEVHLWLACAIALSELGRGPQAEPYLLKALRACIPHGFTMLLAVNVPLCGGLIEKLLRREFPAQATAVLEQAQRAAPNWIVFHNRFTKENITEILLPKDYQMARLSAQGESYRRIAERFGTTPGAVANRMQIVCEMLLITGSDRKRKLEKVIL